MSEETKEINRPYAYSGSHGKSTALVDCPFCQEKAIIIYVWSFAGGGKKCPNCGAMLSNYNATRVKDVEK